MERKLHLPDKFIEYLDSKPESGMGYQLVSIFLKTGQTLHDRVVLNCEDLVLKDNESIQVDQIRNIRMKNY